jgi:hypothetical protein
MEATRADPDPVARGGSKIVDAAAIRGFSRHPGEFVGRQSLNLPNNSRQIEPSCESFRRFARGMTIWSLLVSITVNISE